VRPLVIGSAAAALLCCLAAAAVAQGQPAPQSPAPESPAPAPQPAAPPQPAQAQARPAAPVSAGDVAGAPRPDQARGLVQDDRSPARHLLWIPRAVLFVPKWGLWLLASPIRGGLYAFERFGLGPRLQKLFSGNGPIAVYPSVAREAGHGLTYGVGAGVGHYVRGNFLFGGEVRQIYDLRLKTHRLLGDQIELELDGQIQLLGESHFYGIGNGDLEDDAMRTDIDARADPTAVDTLFDQRNLRAELTLDLRPRRLRHVTGFATAALIDKKLGDVASTSLLDVAAVYDPASLVGFTGGVRYLYGELRLAYDDRLTTNPFTSLAEPATGWKLEGFAGLASGLAGDPSSYVRYGVDLQRYFDLYLGDRVLILRAFLEGVTADVDDIPFTELPRLGGSRLMRGYPRNRFRDRTVTAFSVEYRYPVNRYLGAFAFVDGGGAWRRLRDFDPAELHPGYGAGLQLHTAQLFLTRFLVAGGDEGVTFYLSFAPSSDLKPTIHNW
jgi:hypothetical protein